MQQRKLTVTAQFKLKKLTDKNKHSFLLRKQIFSLIAQSGRKEN